MELTIHYRMDMASAADWYLEAWDRHTTIPHTAPDKVYLDLDHDRAGFYI